MKRAASFRWHSFFQSSSRVVVYVIAVVTNQFVEVEDDRKAFQLKGDLTIVTNKNALLKPY